MFGKTLVRTKKKIRNFFVSGLLLCCRIQAIFCYFLSIRLVSNVECRLKSIPTIATIEIAQTDSK